MVTAVPRLRSGLLVAFALGLCPLLLPGQEWSTSTEEAQQLTASDADEGDIFGRRVAMAAGRVVVGSVGDDDDGENSGSVYVYRLDPDTGEWSEEQKLRASDADDGHLFGTSVGIDQERIVVSAERTSAGSAYVFCLDPDTGEWVEEQILSASDGLPDDRFGRSVAIAGDRIVVGAIGLYESGPTYVFLFDAETEEWVEEQILAASAGETEDLFGDAVAISGERIVVGARGDAEDGANSGAAYVFRYDAATEEWVEEQMLTASDAVAGKGFGGSVDISGTRIVVGQADKDSELHAGTAYVFRYDADAEEWCEDQKLVASDGDLSDSFGQSVSIDADRVVIGSHGTDHDGERTGAAYVFRDDDCGEWAEEARPPSCGRRGGGARVAGVDLREDVMEVRCAGVLDTCRTSSAPISGAKLSFEQSDFVLDAVFGRRWHRWVRTPGHRLRVHVRSRETSSGVDRSSKYRRRAFVQPEQENGLQESSCRMALTKARSQTALHLRGKP